MKLNREKPDYNSLDDRRSVQKVNWRIKSDRQDPQGYKEDSEAVAYRIRKDISNHYNNKITGKSDKETRADYLANKMGKKR